MKERNESSLFRFQHSYADLDEFFYTEQIPEKVSNPQLVMLNKGLAEELNIDTEPYSSRELSNIFSGNEILPNMFPISQAYAGHQFGQFTILGDGRVVLLGEHQTDSNKVVDVQLKGSGRTPFSRAGDGRATLGPMIREFIISEALHSLNIPTSRSLAVVVSGDVVTRERPLPGAILTRIASSHLRVGTFQYAQAFGEEEHLRELADYAIDRHYPNISNDELKYEQFLRRVIEQQATTIAKWQLVGFVHGVMNTDNMTITGETIDYGPCAFMDHYDPNTVFSSIDQQGRYAYRNQPPIGMWNLTRFAEALIPLLSTDENQAVNIAKNALQTYNDIYMDTWLNGMRKKLGLTIKQAEDLPLIERLLKIMHEEKMDYTNTFISLTLNELDDEEWEEEKFQTWYESYLHRLSFEKTSEEERVQIMKAHNPAIIPRNYYVEEALDLLVEEADFSKFHALMQVLKNPYAYTEKQKEYQVLPPEADGPYTTYCGT